MSGLLEIPMQPSSTRTESIDLRIGANVQQSLEPDPKKIQVCSLERLAYFSTAVKEPTVSQFEHLLLRARERNASEGVTGVLIYAEGLYVQYLEGPGYGVSRVFRHISENTLHHQLFEVCREPIQSRDFSEWQMGFAATIVSGLAKHFPVNDHLAQRLRTPRNTQSVAWNLLVTCWGNGLGIRRDQWTAS